MSAQRLLLDHTAVLIVDVQERLCAAMEREALQRVLARTGALAEGARALGLPLLVTEQYPKGLGPTHALLKLRLGSFSPVEKLDFSAAVPEVLEGLGARRQVLVAGMETHVCVFQTVRALSEAGYTPHVLVDAVLSRSAEDRQVGLELCREAGARLSTVEASLFDLLGRAGSPEFKRVSAAVK